MTTECERTAIQKADPEMLRILEEMLEADETITARSVARRHGKIRHASSITRHYGRRELLARFQTIQKERRAWLERIPKMSNVKTATEMAKKDQRIGALERTVEMLRASHLAMLRAIGEFGGVSKWLEFYGRYREIREELRNMGVMPEPELQQMKPRGTPGG
jgi:hypothetical protein